MFYGTLVANLCCGRQIALFVSYENESTIGEDREWQAKHKQAVRDVAIDLWQMSWPHSPQYNSNVESGTL